jgi:hypothetical protein
MSKIPKRVLIQITRPPADSEGEDGGRKRKRQEDLISLGT